MDPRLAAAADLAHELEAVIERLDDPAAPPATSDATWQRCEETFGRFRALQDAAGGPGASIDAELRRRLEEIARLRAVATSLAGRARATIAARIDASSDARRSLRHRQRNNERRASGGRCDVSG
jgi:hypothetical protein